MVTETQHLSLVGECKDWYDELAAYRQKINGLKNELYYFAPGKTDQETKLGIEHYHNQFHIQLINIHDVKHEIKQHIKDANHHPNFGHRIPHNFIKEKVDMLIADLNKLEEDFHNFVQS
jgi:hypothetical protein